ncbi:MAG: N-acetylneuraminate synthase, partial [Candidatus Scalindua sp.]|nr:N-acetylneuraminate synthase [Candidatus Scalindua sp.]
TTNADKARYQIENTGTSEPQIEMLRRLELSPNVHKGLFAYCRQRNISFLSTPFDEESADMLDDLGMEIFKIPSGEITNKPLIQHIASKKKPIILSTGMSYLGEVENAISWIDEIWNTMDRKPQLSVLHCVSSYPARIEDVNLRVINTIKMAFGLCVGYSDHTMGTEITMAAVAMGAKVIEKHFTLDRDMEGPDHKASLEPEELEAMVTAIRNVERAMGDGIKKPTRSENDLKKTVRRSLVTAKEIKAGDTISPNDIFIKRPGTGISAEFKDKVVGMKSGSDISADSVIKWEDLKHA